jgi:protocatechuate 3,4-dioxygenase beta subunit
VHVWQVGCDGKYPYIPLRTKINHKLINLNSKSTFQGSGTATTDNLGEFTFITMHPISAHVNYINLRIEHKNFKNTQTKLFLNHKPSTILYNQDLDYKDNEYYFDIVVPRHSPA